MCRQGFDTATSWFFRSIHTEIYHKSVMETFSYIYSSADVTSHDQFTSTENDGGDRILFFISSQIETCNNVQTNVQTQSSIILIKPCCKIFWQLRLMCRVLG